MFRFLLFYEMKQNLHSKVFKDNGVSFLNELTKFTNQCQRTGFLLEMFCWGGKDNK